MVGYLHGQTEKLYQTNKSRRKFAKKVFYRAKYFHPLKNIGFGDNIDLRDNGVK